jgi:hypothetical protein
MANTLLTPTKILDESLMIFENNLTSPRAQTATTARNSLFWREDRFDRQRTQAEPLRRYDRPRAEPRKRERIVAADQR